MLIWMLAQRPANLQVTGIQPAGISRKPRPDSKGIETVVPDLVVRRVRQVANLGPIRRAWKLPVAVIAREWSTSRCLARLDLQRACVPASVGGYHEQWRQAQRLLAARRRIWDFTGIPDDGWRQHALCSLAPRWPAEDSAPPGVPPHDEDTALSLVGWMKRRWAYLNDEDGFPSTASIASAPYRGAVLEHLADEDVRAALADFARAARAVETAPEAPVPGLAAITPDSGPGTLAGASRRPVGLPGSLAARGTGP
jgi:hypothetical protein